MQELAFYRLEIKDISGFQSFGSVPWIQKAREIILFLENRDLTPSAVGVPLLSVKVEHKYLGNTTARYFFISRIYPTPNLI